MDGDWLEWVQTIGIVFSILFSGIALRIQSKTTRVQNYLTVTQHHREVWRMLLENEKLSRVVDSEADLSEAPITNEEFIFVNMILLHVSAAINAIESGTLDAEEVDAHDVAFFLSCPIPREIWEQTKDFREPRLLEYVAKALKES